MNQNPNAGAGLLCGCICVLVALAGVLAIYFFFCRTLARTQAEVHPRNRLISPGLVWLHCLHLGGAIPLLGILFGIVASIWDLIMVLKLAGSLRQEFEDRGWRTDGEGFGRVTGLIWTVGQLAGLPFGLAINWIAPNLANRSVVLAVALALIVLGITFFVCWIVYWVQMAGYGRRLREGRGGYRRGSVEEDYDDDFYRPHRQRDVDDEFEDRNRPRRGIDDDHDDYDDRHRRRDRDD